MAKRTLDGLRRKSVDFFKVISMFQEVRALFTVELGDDDRNKAYWSEKSDLMVDDAKAFAETVAGHKTCEEYQSQVSQQQC